jgi:hypothetical protein
MVTAAGGEVALAYEECERLARDHPENFPVASWLLPKELRKHVAVIYASGLRCSTSGTGSWSRALKAARSPRGVRC